MVLLFIIWLLHKLVRIGVLLTEGLVQLNIISMEVETFQVHLILLARLYGQLLEIVSFGVRFVTCL